MGDGAALPQRVQESLLREGIKTWKNKKQQHWEEWEVGSFLDENFMQGVQHRPAKASSLAQEMAEKTGEGKRR